MFQCVDSTLYLQGNRVHRQNLSIILELSSLTPLILAEIESFIPFRVNSSQPDGSVICISLA